MLLVGRRGTITVIPREARENFGYGNGNGCFSGMVTVIGNEFKCIL